MTSSAMAMALASELAASNPSAGGLPLIIPFWTVLQAIIRESVIKKNAYFIEEWILALFEMNVFVKTPITNLQDFLDNALF